MDPLLFFLDKRGSFIVNTVYEFMSLAWGKTNGSGNGHGGVSVKRFLSIKH